MGPYRLYSAAERELLFTSSLGCDSIVELRLKEYPLYIPNAFSPNGDGINDTFQLFTRDNLIQVESLIIFDRWGNQLFQQTEGETFEWDGGLARGQITAGVYMYLVELALYDGKRKVLSGDLLVVK